MRILLLISLFIFAEFPQNKSVLLFEHPGWDFGRISDKHGTISHEFWFENISETPVIIEDIVQTCGCLVPTYNKKTIMPGEKGVITVVLDPKKVSPRVNKNIKVICNTGKLVYRLTIKGFVDHAFNLKKDFPYEISGHIRVDRLTINFGELQQHESRKEQIIRVANLSDKKVQLSYRQGRKSGCLTVSIPLMLAPRAIGEIKITALANNDFYGSFTDKLEIGVNSKKYRQIQVYGTAVDDMRGVSLTNGPKFESSQSYFNLEEIKLNQTITRRLTLKNTGKEKLIIRKIEYKGKVSSDLTAPLSLSRGESRNVILKVTPDKLRPLDARVKFITNDPGSPVHVVMLEATISKE